MHTVFIAASLIGFGSTLLVAAPAPQDAPSAKDTFSRLRTLSGTWDAGITGDGQPDTVVTYTYEPDARFAVEGRAVIDCAAALHNGVFHLYAPDNGAGANPSAPRPEQEFQPQSPPPRRTASQGLANPENDFEPPVGRDPNAEREAPGSFRLMSARSRDGLTFVPTGEVISDQANVPDLIFNDRGEIHLYYTGGQVGDRYNTTGLAISRDQGKTWTFKHVEVPGFERAGDPDIVRLPDGIWRMFLTTRVNNNIGIIYADSRDGIHFEKRGTAFAKSGLDLLDSTTFQIGSTWHTLTLQGREVRQRHGTSPDATTFAVGEVMPFVADGEPFVAANGVKVDGGYRLYGFSPFPPGKLGFRSFFSKDGAQWTAEPGVRLAFDKVSSGGGTQIKDPSVLKLADGSYLMVYTARIPETRGENDSNATRGRRPGGPGGQIRVEKIDSKYKTAPGAKPGSFVTGQDADIVLGSKVFNNSGGALLFNHPTGLATDGKLVVGGMQSVYLWNNTPRNAETDADVALRPTTYRNGDDPDAHTVQGAKANAVVPNATAPDAATPRGHDWAR